MNSNIIAILKPYIWLIELGLLLLFWQLSFIYFLPKPIEVWDSYHTLINKGFIGAIFTSLRLTIEAIVCTAIIGLLLSYSTKMPRYKDLFIPLVNLITKFRFNSLVGLGLFFQMYFSGHALKLIIIVVFMAPWFISSMLNEINEIDRKKYDHARTLGYSELKVWYEVVIYGTRDKAIEVIRQTNAISWGMLSLVESMVRSEGGIGVILKNDDKMLNLEPIFGIIIVIVLIGITTDYILKNLRVFLFPYCILSKAKDYE